MEGQSDTFLFSRCGSLAEFAVNDSELIRKSISVPSVNAC